MPKNGRNPPCESFLESRGFRPEIQGLRAFAVLLVVVYHVWVGKVSGGGDVFLFISAFLLSLSFMRKINEGKPLESPQLLDPRVHPPATRSFGRDSAEPGHRLEPPGS